MNADDYFRRGVHSSEHYGDDEKALDDFSEAISLNPRLVDAYINRALIYQKHQNHKAVIRDCLQVIKLTTNNEVAYQLRGQAYYQQGQYDLAIVDFNSALAINPKLSDAKKYRDLAIQSQDKK
jgi:tetratricopeptide (TPR) repeat protein